MCWFPIENCDMVFRKQMDVNQSNHKRKSRLPLMLIISIQLPAPQIVITLEHIKIHRGDFHYRRKQRYWQILSFTCQLFQYIFTLFSYKILFIFLMTLLHRRPITALRYKKMKELKGYLKVELLEPFSPHVIILTIIFLDLIQPLLCSPSNSF